MRKQFNLLAEWLLPKRCLLCDADCPSEKFLCRDCESILPWQPPACFRCASVLPDNSDFVLCASCLTNPPAFDSVTALFQYQPPISQFILKLKFQHGLSFAKLLSQYWIHYLMQYRPAHTLPEYLMPVPLHYQRLSERGFNQALEMVKPISTFFHIPIDIKSCIRIRNTEPQATLPFQKRQHNLKNAFALSHAIHAKHIAIVDDVMTTGNTVSEMSQLLRKNGVENIEVWCCARATKY